MSDNAHDRFWQMAMGRALRSPDHDQREWARDAYARTHEQPLPFNDGYGDGPFTVEDALAWAERLANSELAPPGWDS